MGSSSRSLPLPAVVAALGGIGAIVSLLLPWFEVNTAALADVIAGMDLDKLTLPGLDPQDVRQGVSAGVEQMRASMSADLVGYRTFHPITVVLQALGGATALWVALRILGGDEPHTHSGALLGATVAIAARPVYALVNMPGAEAQASIPLLTADHGLYLAIASAALLILAVLAAMFRGSAAQSNDWTPQAGAVPGSAHVPMGLTAQAPAPQAYTTPSGPSHHPAGGSIPAPPAAAFSAGAPVPYEPSGAYGAEGPSTLDRDSRLVRPNDPLAPKPRAAPVVPIMPAPVEVTPLRDHTPVHDTPGATYGVPRPAPVESTDPTRRPGSTAPPGFS